MRDELVAHIEEYHAFRKEDLVKMVEEHNEVVEWIQEMGPKIIETNRNVTLMVDDLYGKPDPTVVDPSHREGGMIILLEEIKSVVDDAIHSGVTTKREWTNGQWAFAAAILSALAAFVLKGWVG